MKIFMPEHSKAAYLADFALYGIAVLALAIFLILAGPRGQALEMLMLVALGLMAWTAVEYFLHRVILHGVQPFKRWHEEHHRRPTALIRTPTILSASLIASLIFFPILLFGGSLWRACSLTLGLLMGYLMYSITHHAIHHWRVDNGWLKKRQQWHGSHHDSDDIGRFGITIRFWDRVFGTTGSVAKKIT
jgi:sterol desaturase/sphingolipid hydroxylase (fatty acid hydroxylase superfamily)